jgi:hypothetical protein
LSRSAAPATACSPADDTLIAGMKRGDGPPHDKGLHRVKAL